jgi:hypothetical protein
MRRLVVLSLIGIVVACPAAVVFAQSQFPALSGLEHGEWELKERGSEAAPRRLCIGDPGQLLQPFHVDRQCRRYVLENGALRAAVTYDCAQAGQGRTQVRVETSRLVQIESQGISGGAPFSVTLEGRRVGACKTAALAR